MTKKNNKDLVTPQLIVDTLTENYMPYAMSVIVSRAIPDIDGLKPSQRKILYTMYKMHLLKGARTKSANVVGQTMKLHPHGDQTIYDTMVRMSTGNDALLHPYVDSKGNFGKASSRDMAYAAPRYTEVKLSGICEEFFRDIEQGTVEFVDNYDGMLKEPTLFPVSYPNILVSENKGIAVGMASSFPGFNLKEVCTYTKAKLKDEGARAIDYIPGPDFSTGAFMIEDKSAIESIFDTGVGSVRLRAKYSYDAKNRCVEIGEIPYSTTVEAIIDKIISVYKQGKLKEISEVRDETDLKGLKIAIDVKRGTDVELLMAKLYKMTPLEDSFSCNMNLLVKGRPSVMGVSQIIDEWIENRLEQIVGRLSFESKKHEDRLHLLEGLEKVLLDIDKAIKIIRGTEDDKKVVPNLMAGFAIDEIQAEYVAEIKLRNLNKDYLLKAVTDIVKLKSRLEEISNTLASKQAQKAIIDSELDEVIKKYSAPRRTEIIQEAEHIELTEETLIEDYNIKLFMSKQGYIKKISLKSLKASGEQKYKEDDELLMELSTSNAADIMVFTDKCNVYFIKAHEMQDHKASDLGSYVYNLLEIEPSEKVLFIHATTDYSGQFLFAFKDGKLAKVPLSSYVTKTNRKKLLKAYGAKSPLLSCMHLEKDIDVIIARTDSKSKNLMLINTSLIAEKSTRSTQGVQAIRLKKNSWISDFVCADDMKLENMEYYRSLSIPAAGTPILPEDYFKGRNLKPNATLW